MNVLQRCDGGCRGPTKMISCVLLITLLVFGVNMATATDPAETSSSTDATTTNQAKTDCKDITSDKKAIDIIRDCRGAKTPGVRQGEKFEFDISTTVTQEEVNSYFQTLTNNFPFNFRLENNNEINTINFGGVAAFSDTAVFTIKNNRKLKTIEGGDSELEIKGPATVRGNRLLTADSIKKLKAMSVRSTMADIQDEKECIVPSLITDLKDLDECGSVYGDLTFTNWPIGTTSNEIKWITGNLKIVNTDLTKLPFSQTEKIKIDGNFEFQDNHGLCWINDENYKDYFEVKGKVRIRNTPCPYTPSAPINTTTKKTKKQKKTTTTFAPVVTDELTTKNSNTVYVVISALSTLLVILL